MAGKRNVKIETPGEATVDQVPEAVEAVSDMSDANRAEVVLPQPQVEAENGASTKLTPAQEATLQANLAATAQLVGSDQALDWSSLNGGVLLAEARKDPDAGLPEYADPDQIKVATLTRAGWVLPTHDKRARFGQR